MTVGEMTEAAPGEGDDEEKLCMQKRHCQSTTPSMSLSELRYNVMTVTVADTPYNNGMGENSLFLSEKEGIITSSRILTKGRSRRVSSTGLRKCKSTKASRGH